MRGERSEADSVVETRGTYADINEMQVNFHSIVKTSTPKLREPQTPSDCVWPSGLWLLWGFACVVLSGHAATNIKILASIDLRQQFL